jgi:hypothetical protein
VLDKETHIKIGSSLEKMVEIDFKDTEEFDDPNSFWTFLLPNENKTRYVEFLQKGTGGFLNLCEVEIYGTKGKKHLHSVLYVQMYINQQKILQLNKIKLTYFLNENNNLTFHFFYIKSAT